MKKYITTERTNLFEPNSIITMKFSIEGTDLSDNEIERAVYAAMEANEVLNSKVILSADGQAWYEKCETQNNKVVVSDMQWEEVFYTQIKIRFHIEEGELIRVFILGNKDKKTILIMAHHLAGDGKSTVYFIEDIMNALSGKQVLYKEMTILSAEKLPKSSKLPLISKAYANYYNYSWKRKGKAFSIDDIKRVHDIYWKQHKTMISIEHFSSKELKQLIKEAREANVKLTSYIIAAFCELMPVKISTGLAVDGRTDGNRSMGNQATGISVDYKYNKRLGFSQNARVIQKKIDKKLQSSWKKYFVLKFMSLLNGSLVDSVYMYLAGIYKDNRIAKLAKVLGYSEVHRDLSITNLTKLDIQNKYGAYSIKEFLFVPPIIAYGKRLIGIATLGDEMYISYHLMENAETDAELKYFNKVMERLKKL